MFKLSSVSLIVMHEMYIIHIITGSFKLKGWLAKRTPKIHTHTGSFNLETSADSTQVTQAQLPLEKHQKGVVKDNYTHKLSRFF